MLLIPLLLAVWGFKWIYPGSTAGLRRIKKEDVWFIIFIFISLFSSFYAWVSGYADRNYYKDYLLGISLYICCFGTYLLTYSTVANEKVKEIRRRKGFIFIGVILLSSIPALCVLFYNYFQAGLQTITYSTRIVPPFEIHSTYFVVQLFLALGLLLAFKKIIWKFPFLVLIFLYSAALYISFQRAALVGVLVGLVTFFFYKNRKLSLAILFLVFISVFIFPGFYKDIFYIYQEGVREDRLYLWQDALRLIKMRPLVGIGVGGYGFFTLSPIAKSTTYSAHNIYLDLAVDSGIFGLMSFMIFLFFLWRRLVNQYYGSKQKIISEVTLGFIAAFVAICASSLFGDFILPELSNLGYYGIRGIIYFWAALGTIMGINEGNNKYEE